MKKIIVVLLILSAMLCGITASAAQAATLPSWSGMCPSGILFEDMKSVKIQKEDIKIIYDLDKAYVTSVYTLANSADEVTLHSAVMTQRVTSLAVRQGENALPLQTRDLHGAVANDAINNWSKILQAQSNRPEIFGDGTGYIEYTVVSAPTDGNSATFTPTSRYYTKEMGESFSGGTVTLYSIASGSVLTTKDTVDWADAVVTTRAIPDFYDYIYAEGIVYLKAKLSQHTWYRFTEDSESATVAARRQEMYNTYLNNLSTSVLGGLRLPNLNAEETGLQCAEFDVVVPGGSSELSLSYIIYLSGDPNKYTLFNFYLTPQEYRVAGSELNITLELSKSYPVIKGSSLDFDKTATRKFSYSANDIPSQELSMKLYATGWQRFVSFVKNPAVLWTTFIYIYPITIAAILIILLTVRIVRLAKKNKQAK